MLCRDRRMCFLSAESRQTLSTERGESVYPLQKEEADSLSMKERMSSVPVGKVDHPL